MSSSILNDVKKMLGIADDYTIFNQDIMICINSTLTVLHDLGVGPDDVLVIEDTNNDWDELALPDNQLGMVKSYLYLKVRLLFDPPAMSFHIDALKNQIEEHECRLKERRESLIPVPSRDEIEGSDECL